MNTGILNSPGVKPSRYIPSQPKQNLSPLTHTGRDQVQFGGPKFGTYPDFDFESEEHWKTLGKDVLADQFSGLGSMRFFSEAGRLLRMFGHAGGGFMGLVNMAKRDMSDFLPDNLPESSGNPLLDFYVVGKHIDSNNKDLKKIPLFALESLDGVSRTFERSDKPSVQSFKQTVSKQIRSSAREDISKYLSHHTDDDFMHFVQECTDQACDIPKSLPTAVLFMTMFDSSKEVRDKAYKQFSEFSNKQDTQGNSYISPAIATCAYLGLEAADLMEKAEQEGSSAAYKGTHQFMAENPEFNEIVTTAKNRFLSHVVSQAGRSPHSMIPIEAMLDEVDLPRKQTILKALQREDAFNQLHPETRARLFQKGYDLKNGELLPKAILDYQARVQAASAQEEASDEEAGIPAAFKESIHDALLQNSPHGMLFVVQDPAQRDALGRYAEQAIGQYCRDAKSSYLVKTIRSKQDSDALFQELAQIQQANPKVLAIVDNTAMNRKARHAFWTKMHIHTGEPSATYMVLFSPDPAGEEYDPFKALQNRIATIPV